MGDMLSQAEIDALLSGAAADTGKEESSSKEQGSNERKDSEEFLTPQEIDALGEIGNICMGTSATTLYTLLGQKVSITTPRVEVTTWDDLSKDYTSPYVTVYVKYIEGLSGANLLIMKEEDVKIITNLMMGGDGTKGLDDELSDFHLSAISEAMNQMVGSSATSLSSMFDKRVDISPPEAQIIHFESDRDKVKIDLQHKIVKISFKLKVGELIDSEIMQILPIDFAKELVSNLIGIEEKMAEDAKPKHIEKTQDENMQQSNKGHQGQGDSHAQKDFSAEMPPPQPEKIYEHRDYDMQQKPQYYQRSSHIDSPINVQPAQFESFEPALMEEIEKKNISLLMDVPLQITVELGRTKKKIREILEFGQGSIIELDKLAGEPVDILVNGKNIAKGEVVVIDESFGVRITDIIHPSKRL